MKSQYKYWPGLIPALIIIYFPLNHYQDMIDIPLFRTFFSILYILFIVFIMLGTTLNKKYMLNVVYSLNNIYIYLSLLCATLIVVSYFSSDIYFSSSRSMISVFMLGLLITTFYLIQYFYLQNVRWRNFLEISSLLFLITLVLGQLLIEEWSWQEIRFSGGINPNRMGFYTLFFLFQAHLNALIDGEWNKLRKTVWLMSFIIIIWTFSRTAILTVLVVYAIYTGYLLILKINKFNSHYIKFKSIFTFSVKFIIYTLISIVIIRIILNSDLYLLILERLLNIDNVTSRNETWKVILTTFQENPLFGGYGWWGSKEVLMHTSGTADSSHNFFIRMLTEVGLIGTIAIVLLPIIIIALLYLNRKKVYMYYGNFIAIYLISIIISMFFVAQIFEDRYLTMFFANTSDVIIWFLSLSLIIYQFSKNKFMKKEVN